GRRRRSPAGPAQVIRVRLAHRLPYSADGILAHLALTAVPGVEEFDPSTTTYRRTLRLPHGSGVVAVTPRADHVEGAIRLSDLRDLPSAVARVRWLLDLDADPVAVDTHLAEEPALRRVIARDPGRRVPRCTDGDELALRVVLGQQISTAAAARHAARLVSEVGERLDEPDGTLTHLFPTAGAVAGAPDRCLRLPDRRRRTLRTLAEHLARGELRLDPAADRDEAAAHLAELPGVGPWTASVIAMRALGDPDAFLADDLGVRRAAVQLGLPDTPARLVERSARWRPWRAYATQYLWAALDHPVATLRRQT
ncbi:MAG TPA: AlkA N-terminal domain-containing protein, partial [Acidimicrobiales bacterium]|nr:AlkA N-terminal domain-containing protein [Acidimicrobiales bacterium]